MRFSLRCLPVFSIGLMLVGCQGDAQAPVALDRTLDGAAAIKCPWEKSITDIYENKFKSDKTAACKEIAEHMAAADTTAAELGINQLLVALYNDYAACVGLPFGKQDLAACPFKDGASVHLLGVVDFAQKTCNLADPALPQTGDVDCVVPTVDNLTVPDEYPCDSFCDPTALNPVATAGGWIAVASVAEGDSVILPSGEFGIQIDDLEAGVSEVFVAIRENKPTPVVGVCPVNSDNDCVQNNYTVDMDGVGEAYSDNDPIADSPAPGLYIEICEGPAPFAEFSVPARCESSSNTCEPAQSIPDRDLLKCSKGALAFEPSTWTAADGALAVRDVLCQVESHSPTVSEGTTCTVFDEDNDLVDSCLALPTPDPEDSPKAAECMIFDILAANLDDAHDGSPVPYTMVATKIEKGVSHTGSAPFDLSQTDPMFGEVEIVPVIDVLPPGQE